MEDTNTDTGGAAAVVRDLMKDYYRPVAASVEAEKSVESLVHLVLPEGMTSIDVTKSLQAMLPAPRFRVGGNVLATLDSFMAYVNNHKTEQTAIYFTKGEAPKATAIFDHHAPGGETGKGWCKDRAEYHFPVSREWMTWNGQSGKPMDMPEFAAFLEDNVIDVINPGFEDEGEWSEGIRELVNLMGGKKVIAGPTALMTLATNMHVHERSRAVQTTRLQSGEGQVAFESEHIDAKGAPLKVPSLFLLRLPVFDGDFIYRVAARLRYRLTGGKLVFWYELWRPDKAMLDALEGAATQVREEVGIDPYYAVMVKPQA